MELSLDRQNNGTEFARYNKIVNDKYGRPIIIAADKPILDTRMYKFYYADGYKTLMTANATESNFFPKSTKMDNIFYYSMPS